ncbi:MAG: hypothetical protein Q9162_000194 [Coniocarpon cinnabarinum]
MASPQPKRAAPADATASSNSKKPKKTDSTSKPAKTPGPEAQLQQSCLSENAELRRVFIKLLREKPASIGQAQFIRDFWASRQHLLRAHAVEKEQGRGRYNVLSEVRPRVKEGGMRIDFGREHVREIFRMHPVVQTAYNDLTDPARPEKERMGEAQFWNAFFLGRLCKKLRGERIREDDPRHPLLDRYLDMSDEEVRIRLGKQVAGQHVPHYIDLEGNESNTKYRGNAPDWDMRQDVLSNDKMPIIRRLNATSETIMGSTEAADPGSSSDPHAPVGMDEETWRELQLRDLQSEGKEDRVRLRIQDQAGLSKRGHSQSTKHSKQQSTKHKAKPKDVLNTIQHEVNTARTGALDLSTSINFPEPHDDSDDSDDSDDDNNSSTQHTTALKRATAQIQHLISPAQPFTQPSPAASTETIANALNWPATSRDNLTEILLTHQTTTEFLHYFWSLITTRGPTLATELPSLMGALEKSLARLKSQGEAAEVVRKGRLEELKKEAQERARRTRGRAVVEEGKAGPGEKEVKMLVAPLVRPVEEAIKKGGGVMKEMAATKG